MLLRLALLLLLLAPARLCAEPIAVIVHPARQEPMDRHRLALILLKEQRHWADGGFIVPLNLPARHPVRERFERAVFGARGAFLAEHWNAKYFHGAFPPVVLESEDAVLRYVASDRNAIGYVSADHVDSRVRVALSIE